MAALNSVAWMLLLAGVPWIFPAQPGTTEAEKAPPIQNEARREGADNDPA